MSHVHHLAGRVSICLLALLSIPLAAHAQLVTAPGIGGSPVVRVIDVTGTERSFFAYDPAFPGGVRVALGDVNGDGVLDIITGAGPGGGPHVRVWNGVTLAEIGGFFAYDPAFPGGVFVAAGDVNGDGRADIITGAGAGGGPHVRIWSGVDFSEIGGFFAYDPAFAGGVTVAAGDVNGDGRADIVTGAGPGGGPHVRVWNGANLSEIFGFFAYDPAFAGGVFVAAGDVNGDGHADVVTGAGPGGGPHVRVWSGTDFSEIGGFFALDPGFPGGVTVAVQDFTHDGRVEIITGWGPGSWPVVGMWDGADLSLLGAYHAVDPSFTGGVFVASVGASRALRFTSATATTFDAGSAGTFSVTTAGGAAVPTLTVTGTLPGGVTFTDNGDRTATLAGTPTAAGVFPLTFTANNGVAPPVTQTFTLTVRQAPAITSANNTAFNVGSVGGSFTVTTTGSPTPAIAIGGAMPSGITFTDNNNGTATFAGTAAAGTAGTYPLTISASNGVGSAATQSFTLTVTQGTAITSVSLITFVAGTPNTFTVTTTGSPTATTIGATGALPTGVTFTNNGNGTATLAGTPGATTGGSYPLTITATNGVGSAAVQNFTLTVNQAPAITSATSTTFTIGQAGSFTVTSTGFPVSTLAAGGAALPSGVTFVDNSNGTGTLSGTPGAGTGGPYALTFTASNGVGTQALQNFTLTVACPSIDLTPAGGSLIGGTFGLPYSATIGATGSTGITFAVTAGTLPSGVTLASTGTLSGTATNTGTFLFTVTATDAFLCTGSATYSITVIPNAVDESYSGAVGNTQLVVAPLPASSTPAVLVTGTVLGNDAGPGPLSAGPAGIASAGGGTIAMSASGAFVYTPAIGFAGPADTFVYTLTDGNGVTDTATVTVNVSGLVWYVDNSGANGDGRSHSPFNALNNAQAPSNAGDVIFVHAGVGSTPGAITLKANQTLWGNAHAFSLNSLSIGASGTPVLAGSVTLANGVLVRALNISSGAAEAIVGTGLTGTETLETVNITGGVTGLNLTNVGGTLNFNNGSITNVVGTDVRIIGGNGEITIASTITNTAGRSVDIENRTGGSVGFTRSISDTDQGILLNNNGTAPVLFLGGLTLDTGPNAAFTATNGGRVSATQDNVSIVNTITTTTGTALNVTNYSIGTFGLTFRSISANGAVNGIVLNNTGTNAGLTVTGTGSANSGGTIQNATGDAIVATETQNLSLTSIRILTPVGHGINATNLRGTSLLANSTIQNYDANHTATRDGFRIVNFNADLALLTVTGTTFNGTTADGVNPGSNDGVFMEAQGTSSMTLVVEGNSIFEEMYGDGIQVNGITGATGTVRVTVRNSTFRNASVEGNGGISFNPFGGIAFLADVDGNTFTNLMQPVTTLGAIGMTNGGTVSADITVRNNTLNSLAGGRGSSMTSDGGVLRMLVDNNSIDGLGSTSKSAVHVNFTDNISLGTSAAGHVTVTNNHIGQQGALWTSGDGLANAILLQTQAAATMTGLISGNVVDANTTSIIEVSRVRAIGTSAMNVIVTNNDLEDTSGTRVEFDATTASSGAINLDISDNTIATIVGVIKLSETAGTLNVEQSSAAAVSIANNGATVTSTGSPQFGTGNPPVPALPTLPM